jgi:hypothetical protein
MRLFNRLAWLAVMAAAALVALSGTALATNSTPTGGSTTTACSTPGGTCPTVTPAGNYTGTGSSMLNPDTSTSTIDCTGVTVTGSLQEDGTGTVTVTWGTCVAVFFSCTVGDVSTTGTAKVTTGGGALITLAAASSRIQCPGANIDCVVFTTNAVTPTPGGNTFAHLLIDGTTHQTVTFTGRVDSTDPTCKGVLSGSGRITSPAGGILTS